MALMNSVFPELNGPVTTILTCCMSIALFAPTTAALVTGS
jgi:hypothetical protein